MRFDLDRDGLTLLPGLLGPEQLGLLEEIIGPTGISAGTRLFGNSRLDRWLNDGPVMAAIGSASGPAPRAVRAILFNKVARTNWTLGWHQDRTIAVRQRVEGQPGFDHWTIKAGVTHVEPPFSFIENMVTARIHLDDVGKDNAPLLVSLGSHRLGRIKEPDVDKTIERGGTVACLAKKGDVWLYRTAILHASEKSRIAASRRVLQVDFSSESLPPGLEWLGIA